MTFLKNLFKKTKVKKLLGGGLIYKGDEADFYIDSNTDIRISKKHIQIFRNDIRKVFNNDFKIINAETYVADLEKMQIALKVKKILEAEGVDVEITPPFPLDFLMQNK